jgi:hypothetical protein
VSLDTLPIARRNGRLQLRRAGLVLVLWFGLIGFIIGALLFRRRRPSESPQFVFRLNKTPEIPGPNVMTGMKSDAVYVTAVPCPFCRKMAPVHATAKDVRIECRSCGTLHGTADVEGIGVYSIPLPKVDV